jgi:hypothetical protein
MRFIFMRKLILGAIVWAMCSSLSSAALITYSYTAQDASFDPSANLLDYIDSSASVTTSNLSSFNMVSSEQDAVSKVTISLDLPTANTFSVFAGLDASYGAEIYFNGTLLTETNDDLWWQRSFSNPDVIDASSLVSGAVTIDIVWAEECCGGQSSIAFTSDLLPSEFLILSISNLERLESAAALTSVDAPSNGVILAMGMLLLGLRRVASRN